MSPNQLNIKPITKNNKNLRSNFLQVTTFVNDAHYCDAVKRKQKPTKKLQICKNHENWIYENWLFQEERQFEEQNHYWEQNVFQKINDVICIEMLSYNLTEIKFSDLKNQSLFLLKTNIFKIHSQQKLSTKRVESLSCNYSEN